MIVLTSILDTGGTNSTWSVTNVHTSFAYTRGGE